MKPKKSKTFIIKTAEDLDLNKTLIEDVVNFYWKKIRVSLSTLNCINVNILNLGSFKIRVSKINLIKDKYKKYIKNLEIEPMTFDKHVTRNTIKEKLEKINEIEDDIKQYRKRKKEIKIKREEYINNKNLESKESDSRRNKE